MALGGLTVSLIVVDALLRRLILPFILLLAVIFRYNLISFVYLLLLLVLFLLPGPRLKSQKVSNIVFLTILVVFSGIVTLVQVLFQISLVTPYKDELSSPCDNAESIWRQVGFVLFEVPAVDVVRLLLPDVIVFIVSLLTMLIDIFVVVKLKPGTHGRAAGDNGGSTAEGDKVTEVEARHVPTDSERDGVLSDYDGPPFPKNIQSYWEIPNVVVYSFEFGIFILLGLSGIAVPSLTSFVYFAAFLVLLVIWSVHMRLVALVRLLRTLLTFYSAIHLLVLHLFQFPSAQSYIRIGCFVSDCDATTTLPARLFGLTPIIMTTCSRPTELLLWSNLNYTVFLSPAFVFILFCVLATDLRMWLFTPQILWRMEFMYFLPIQDEAPSSRVKCVLKKDSKRSQILEGSKSYGTMGVGGPGLLQMDSGGESDRTTDTSSPELVAPILTTKKKIQQNIMFKVKRFTRNLWTAIFRVAFIFTVVAMMVWSVLYPSWPSLVLLIWSFGIWLIPRLNPRDSVLYTSPSLVVYSAVLLLIQYIYSLELTTDEFQKNVDIVLECQRGGEEGCKSIVLLVKTSFTVIFFASFREFVRVAKEKLPKWWAKHRHHADAVDARDERELSGSTEIKKARSQIYSSIYRLLCTYWVVMVVGAFLLVILTGEPSALKCVYLVFFFLFMITYQVAPRYWFFFCLPIWWLLVFYAAIHLVLIYTYPFTVINGLWEEAYDRSGLNESNISSVELFESIGFIQYRESGFRTLLMTLVPPAVFIAAMALQLRFFNPRYLISTTVSSQATLDVYSLLPKGLRETLNKLNEFDIGEYSDEENDGDDDEEDDDSDSEIHRISPTVHSIKSSALRESHPKLYTCYKITKYAFNKTRQIIVNLNSIIWRFLELHLHKIAALVLFATSLSQISAAYWVLLVLVLVMLPLPCLNPFIYPVITLYLGVLSAAKMVYNLPIMSDYYLNFSSTRSCQPIIDDEINGTVYYSLRVSDTNWVGLHFADSFANYIILPIVCALLLSLWFSARRYQARYYNTHHITVEGYELGSLFLNVTRQDAEKSIIASLKYLINHFFEMYGVEVCWAMLAIAVAVRIDVYGVIYAVILALLLLFPWSPIFYIYLLIQGALLAVQYFFLLGAPPSACYNTKPNSTVYPWSDIQTYSPSALKKWLFVPDDTQQILNGHLLYADILVYIVVCLQLKNIIRSPLKHKSSEHATGDVPNFYELKYWNDYIKVFVFQYSFWFSLFLLFFTASYRVSLFGIFYLLIGFYVLYRGQEMLRDRQAKRHKSWAFLRFVTWITLLIRVSVQILDCVFWIKFIENTEVENCLLILLFNGACTIQEYYGSEVTNCPDQPQNLGLWIDALNFIVITLQIIIFDTQYADIVRVELTRKMEEAQSFREVFDIKVKENQESQQEKKQREREELIERAAKLNVSEKTIDHLLYAGVRVPEDLKIRRPNKRRSASSGDTDHDLGDSTSITSDTAEQKTVAYAEKTTVRKIYLSFIEVVDWLIEQLEEGSKLYREVVSTIKESLSPADLSRESEPIAREGTRYGGIGETPKPATIAAEAKQLVEVEVHEDVQTQGADVGAGKTEETPPTEKESKKKKKKKKMKKSKSVGFADAPGDELHVVRELHIQPSDAQEKEIRSFEHEVGEKALRATSRLRRLSTAIYYFLLAHSDYPVFFFIILNIVLNGSVLSLVYAILLYSWGLLSIPWPTRKFWLSLIFYTMSVLVIKYAFQFQDIPYWSDNFNPSSGLYPPRVLGILHQKNFFTNAVWDILLLIALLLHRGLLEQYGLWNTGPQRGVVESFVNIFSQLWHDVKDFFRRLFDPNISQGAKDYYAVMLFFDILCFVTIAAGVNSFGIGFQTSAIEDLTAVAEFVRNNNVPLLFVALLLLQFLSMVVDRAIYVRRSLPAKFVFQVILLLGWHVGLFFLLPSDPLTGRPFTENPAAQCLYFFKSCYFIVSSLQIVAGYPVKIIGYLLASSYNTVSWLLFLVYRLIPLLPELRETCDWTFTDTSLSLINWFKVQEIYSLIYLVKVQRNREKSYPRDLGEKQSWLIKIFVGGLLLVCLIVLIWLPLLLISVVGQASEANPPAEVDIKLNMGGFQPLVQLTVQDRDIHPLNDIEYKKLTSLFEEQSVVPVFSREFRQDDFRRVVFPGESTSLWTISPPSREMLHRRLMRVHADPTFNTTISLDFSWSIKRVPHSGSDALETVSGVTTQQLSGMSHRIIEAFIESLDSDTGSVPLPNLYPTLIRAPSTGPSTNFTQISRLFKRQHVNVSCTAYLSSNGSVEWWSLIQDSDYVVEPQTHGQLEMIIYSERVAPQLFSLISGIGIIGLYVSVVLVIGRFIRTYIADLPYRLAVDEILNPDPLIKLCHDIYTVRASGDLKLEEILVGKLFYIFRSSERIVRITEDLKEKTD